MDKNPSESESDTATLRTSPTTAVTAGPDTAEIRRAALAGLIGTTLEQYDFVVYGTASALVFGALFFPELSPTAGLLASFSAYAVGFCARPIGGLFFSRYGDRLGRKWVLVATLALMGVSTMAIGLLPSYAAIGAWAPALLVALRMLQGFGAGAEQSGGATLLTETAPRGRRGRLAALIMTGAAAGTVLGAGAWALAQLLPQNELQSWGWRLVFISSSFVTVAAYILRRKLKETPVFREIRSQRAAAAAPIKEVLRNGKKPVVLGLLMTTGLSVQSYTYQVFMASYLKNQVHVDGATITRVLLVGAIFGGIGAVVCGRLADRFGRRRVFLYVAVSLLVLPVPSFLALDSGSILAIYVVMIVGFVLACQGGVAITMSYLPELFGSRYRYAGVTMGRELAAVLGGGFAPLIGVALLNSFGSWIPVAVYMILAMVVTVIGAVLAPETCDRDLLVARNATDPDAAAAPALA